MSTSLDHDDRTVTVLGAGVAGLTVAYELERLGWRVQVLEGSARVGGRVHSHRFGPGPDAPVAELGAMRIPVRHRTTLACVEQLGLAADLVPFRSHGRGSAGPATAAPAELRADPRLGGVRDDTLALAGRLIALVDAVAPPAVRDQLRVDLRGHLVGVLDRIDVRPHRHRDGSVDLHRVFAANPHLREGCRGDLRSFLDDILTETGDGLVRIRGGMGRLVERLAARISGPVLTGHEVVGLHARPDGAAVEVRDGGRPRLLRSRFVVCTIPFPVLARQRLSGLSDDKLAVLREIRYVPATKVALHCREPFWHRTGMDEGARATGGLLRQTYYPAVDGDPAHGAVLLASYVIGEDADVLDRLPPPVRVATVIHELADIHPELRRPGMVRAAASVAWRHHRWTGGGCSVLWGRNAAEAEEERRRAARPERSVHFAGEHTSATPAWIEGALESAHRVAAELGRPSGERSRRTLPVRPHRALARQTDALVS